MYRVIILRWGKLYVLDGIDNWGKIVDEEMFDYCLVQYLDTLEIIAVFHRNLHGIKELEPIFI